MKWITILLVKKKRPTEALFYRTKKGRNEKTCNKSWKRAQRTDTVIAPKNNSATIKQKSVRKNLLTLKYNYFSSVFMQYPIAFGIFAKN
ncbi:hypothetical protein [Flavobacterium adhaerens]|uniref:hypothetical protein n=1 Tax=Flavobacterium adhaerens TaxID=3149043 RepID=UPI0032B5A5B3